MLVKCELYIKNRHIPQSTPRPCQASLAVIRSGKHGGSQVMQLVVFTAKNKSGTKYQILKNLTQVYSRFIQEGKTTIGIKEPPHDLCLSKAKPEGLKRLVHALKLGCSDRNFDELQLGTMITGTVDLEKPKTEMKIVSQSTYPTTSSFPSTLERLSINDCRLKKLDSRILQLSGLTMLDLSNNLLTKLPDSIDGLPLLKDLDLSKNKFDKWPRCLFSPIIAKQLRALKLNENKLKYIPYEVYLFENLVNLQLSGNELQFVGYGLGYLTSLRYLNISSNKIKQVNNNFMKLKLDTLDMSGNLFSEDFLHVCISNNLDGVFFLREICAKAIRKNRLDITSADIPKYLLHYVMSGNPCDCGNVCYEHSAVYLAVGNTRMLAHTFIYRAHCQGIVPKEEIVCSKDCLEAIRNDFCL